MNQIKVVYWDSNNNWGDALNGYLCEKISGKQIIKTSTDILDSTFRYYCIGSRLESPKSPNYEVWGAGFIKEVSKVVHKPRKVHAIRGKLSREIYLQNNIECPEIYGDPAMLLKYYYNPVVKKKYDVGIIPHYVDQGSQWVSTVTKHNKNIKIINVLSDTEDFVNQVKQCNIILSSTLHGIICADTYNIPGYWIELSDRVVGNGFKFRDYFTSVDRKEVNPIRPKKQDTIESVLNQTSPYEINIDLKKLLYSCPL